MNMRTGVIILGGGGHAKVLADALRRVGVPIVGYTDRSDRALADVVYLGDDEVITRFNPEAVSLANGVGSIGSTAARQQLYDRFRERGFEFYTVVHPSAIVASGSMVDAGAQIMAGVIVQPGCRIGANAIINTRASIDHDCQIGPHVHVAPGVVMCGNVRIGAGAHVGAGAVIVQGRSIGARSVVGAGAVIVEDVPDDVVVVGVPGRLRGRL